MKNRNIATIVVWTVIALSLSIDAQTDKPVLGKRIQEVYPDLTSGLLSGAVLKELPEGTLLRAEGLEIGVKDIGEIVASQPAQQKEQLTRNAFFVLEQEATSRVLVHLAKQTFASADGVNSGQEDSALIQQFFEREVLSDITVTDDELKTFYDKNKDMCGGAALAQVADSLRQYLISQKKQQMASDYVRTLGQRLPIQVSASWVQEQAAMVFDNPVDKARRSGKPSLVDFGATGCKPCDMLAPILETLRERHKDKLNVIFVHVGQEPILASRYGVQSIPIQVFYDENGKELYRHVGFWSQEEIEKKLSEMGVK